MSVAAAVGARLSAALERSGMGVLAFQRAIEVKLRPLQAAGDGRRAESGYSYPAISRYLKGGAEPSLTFLQAAARVLNVRFAWLATGYGLPNKNPLADTLMLLDLPWWAGNGVAEGTGMVHEFAPSIGLRHPPLKRPRFEEMQATRDHARDAERMAWAIELEEWIRLVGVDAVRTAIITNLEHIKLRFSRKLTPEEEDEIYAFRHYWQQERAAMAAQGPATELTTPKAKQPGGARARGKRKAGKGKR